MPLTPEQMAEMDAALGLEQSPEDLFAQMDAALGVEQVGQQGDAGGTARALAYGFTGGNIPFGNVISSGIGAGIAKAASPFTGDERSIGELYEQAQADTRATQDANPGATLGGNVLGIASTLPLASAKALFGTQAATTGIRGSINAIPQGISQVDRFVRGGKAAKDASALTKAGSLALRSAKGAAVAAPVAGLYAAGDTEGDRGEAFVSGARVGAGLGAALPVAGAALGYAGAGGKRMLKGIRARDAEALNDAGAMIKNQASQAYQRMRETGATVNPGGVNHVISNMSKALSDDGVLNKKLHKKTIDLLDDFKQEALDGQITLEGLDQWRQLFGQVAGDFGDKVNARKAMILRDALDETVNALDEGAFSAGGREGLEALKQGRAGWARQSKFNAVVDIVEASSGDANKLKRDLERFRLSPKKTRGWSAEELAALKDASNQTTGEGVLKLVGKFGFDLGSGRAVGSAGLPVIGGILTGLGTQSLGPAAAVPVIGTAARMGQKALARGKAEELLSVIEKGGQITAKQISELPPSEQNKVINRIMQMAPARAGLVNDKVKK